MTFLKKNIYVLFLGILENKSGTISLPIARKAGSIIEREINTAIGQIAITDYTVIKEFDNYSLVHCKLKTGRTHQIRVHMKAIGHPIVGDTLYGCASSLISRQALHSCKIECIHPVSKKFLSFSCELPKDMDFLGQACPKKFLIKYF